MGKRLSLSAGDTKSLRALTLFTCNVMERAPGMWCIQAVSWLHCVGDGATLQSPGPGPLYVAEGREGGHA